jgi:hypothetical protein
MEAISEEASRQVEQIDLQMQKERSDVEARQTEINALEDEKTRCEAAMKKLKVSACACIFYFCLCVCVHVYMLVLDTHSA